MHRRILVNGTAKSHKTGSFVILGGLSLGDIDVIPALRVQVKHLIYQGLRSELNRQEPRGIEVRGCSPSLSPLLDPRWKGVSSVSFTVLSTQSTESSHFYK